MTFFWTFYVFGNEEKRTVQTEPPPPTPHPPYPFSQTVSYKSRDDSNTIHVHALKRCAWLAQPVCQKKKEKKSALSTSVDRHYSEIAWVFSETATPQKSRALYKKEKRRRKKCSNNCMPKLEFVKIRGPAFACYVSVLNAALTANITDGIRPIDCIRPTRTYNGWH